MKLVCSVCITLMASTALAHPGRNVAGEGFGHHLNMALPLAGGIVFCLAVSEVEKGMIGMRAPLAEIQRLTVAD
ncbi:MAG: hypothetical protein OXD29_03625 [Roseovarius sp.]|nr:hypothetical protein [Roseovarius sp.]MCY4315010.1 hypothetical protein [Roseovarius sp.]